MNGGLPAHAPSGDSSMRTCGPDAPSSMQPDIPEDLYQEVIRRVTEIMHSVGGVQATSAAGGMPIDCIDTHDDSPIPPPQPPDSVKETGLTLESLANLALKWIYLQGAVSVGSLSELMRLPLSAIAEALEFLASEGLLERKLSDYSDPSLPVTLSEGGRNQGLKAFSRCRYVGPAPVSLTEYARQCRLQAPKRVRFGREHLVVGLSPLEVSAQLIDELGTALSSGHSMLLSGASGNGKTAIARRLAAILQQVGGPIYVPYAVLAERKIISVFDPAVHRPVPAGPLSTPSDERNPAVDLCPRGHDLRWQIVQRPLVVAPPGIRPTSFDFAEQDPSYVLNAPLHIKANGGMLLLDNLGRHPQLSALADRWLGPLEDRLDSLKCCGERRISLPVEQLTVFVSHRPGADTFDATFLRRIRSKVKVRPPDEHQFREIFRNLCEQRGIHYDDWAVLQFFSRHYSPQKPPKGSDPQDLLDTLSAACRFVGESPRISEHLLAYAFERCICGVETRSSGIQTPETPPSDDGAE